jgi:hypothetical protein
VVAARIRCLGSRRFTPAKFDVSLSPCFDCVYETDFEAPRQEECLKSLMKDFALALIADRSELKCLTGRGQIVPKAHRQHVAKEPSNHDQPALQLLSSEVESWSCL